MEITMRGGFPPAYVEELDRHQILDLLSLVREVSAGDRANDLWERTAAARGDQKDLRRISSQLRAAAGEPKRAGGLAEFAAKLGAR